MSLTLHNLQPGRGATKNRKRVGRGNASGHGTYATRGLKGQKSRAGVSRGNLKRLGMRQMVLSVPKKRGFKSLAPKKQTINLGQLNGKFKNNQLITPQSLLKAGLIAKINLPVKILNKGELKLSGLTFEYLTVSQNAAEQIKKQQGHIR